MQARSKTKQFSSGLTLGNIDRKITEISHSVLAVHRVCMATQNIGMRSFTYLRCQEEIEMVGEFIEEAICSELVFCYEIQMRLSTLLQRLQSVKEKLFVIAVSD